MGEKLAESRDVVKDVNGGGGDELWSGLGPFFFKDAR